MKPKAMVFILRHCVVLFIAFIIFQSAFASPGTDDESYFLTPRIGVAKAASAPVLQSNGSYNVTYTVTLKNYGDEILNNVQVTHLTLIEYPLPAAVTRVGNVVATGSLIGNNNFDGLDVNLLKAGSKLFQGEKQTIVYTLNIVPNGSFGPFLATVLATGTGALLPVLDLSVNGTNPDPNGDGLPLETSLTSVSLVPAPIIGVAKSVSAPQHQADGTEKVTYTIVVKNLGNEKLTNVQVTDLLSTAFLVPATFTVTPPIATGTLVANASFNGVGNVNLLAAGSELNIGQQQTITFTVTINPNGLFGPFLNTAAATASGSLTPTADVSVNGNNPDPDGDGLPIELGATPVSLVPLPIIGLAKRASTPLLQPDNSYNITYTLTVENLGNIQLNNVQVTDVLNSVFPSPSVYVVVGPVVASGSLIAKVGYNGSTTNNLLDTGSSLGIGETQTITFTVNVKPFGILGPYINTALASAVGGGLPVTDASVDGNDPDPNGDGLPLEVFPTLSLLTPVPLIGISKSATAPVTQPNGSYNVTFKITLENLGNEHLTDVKVTDALLSAFVNPSVFHMVGGVVSSGSLVANVGFDGMISTDLLGPGSTLAVGQTQTISFTINVEPHGAFGPFLNVAVATAMGSLLPTTDISVDGNDPDPNGDGLPLETLPTTVSLIPIPIIGVSKLSTAPVLQADGSYNVTFNIKLENLGNEKLNNVQVTDALLTAFVAPSVVSMVGGVVTSGTLIANAGFNGNLTTGLLAPGSTLDVGTTQTISFTVNVKANGIFGPFLNTAIATATGQFLPTTDISVDGNDPDPNGDGLPLETLPTIVSLIPVPLIGVSKSASAPAPQTDGSYLVTFTVTLENLGNEDLHDVQVTDLLVSVFGTNVYEMVGGVIANGTLIANVGFNGNLISTLLAPGSSLPVGTTQKINFTVRLRPDTFFGPFINQAIATAHGSLLPTTDLSVDGNDPDPNGDGLPLETSPTAVLLIPIPVIGLAKSASAPLLQPDGSYNIVYTFTLSNLGNVKLDNVQITDVMVSVFAAPSTFSILGSTVASGTLIANPTFDGNLQTNLLNGGSTLEVGQTQTVVVTINAKPIGFFGPFLNTALATATATGQILPIMDLSMDGTDPDPNDDGIPLETLPTIVTLIPNPIIGLSKNITSTILQADGSYNVTYDLHIKNYGNVALHNILLIDDLSSIFSLSAGVSLVGNVNTTGGLSANLGFNGFLDINLLDGLLGSLPVGGSETVTYTVNVKPNGIFGPYCNTAIVTATGPLGIGLTVDISHVGSDPDPNGNGKPNEPGENECTPATLTPNPVIGVAKAASAPALQANGTYNVTYTIVVRNMGNSALTDVQVVDDLALAFPSTVTIAKIGSVSTTGSLVASATYDGKTDKNLLASGSTLALGASGTITFTLNITPAGNFGPFFNTAIASGKSGGQTTSDISTTGTEPDPNNNGNPGDPGESAATLVALAPNPVVGVAKAASSPLLQPDGSYNVTFTFTVQNLGNVALENVQLTDNLVNSFPSPATFTIVGSIVSPGTLLASSTYDGTATNPNLLAAGSTLAIGATEYVTINLNIQPNGSFGPFFNTATGSAKAVGSSATTSDGSTDGNNPDPNGNHNPGDVGESIQTSVSLVPHPVLGVAKSAGSPQLQSNGSYNVPFTITLVNMGNVALSNVQATDNLAGVIGSPSTFTISTAPAATGTLIANAAFNGNTDINLLAAGSSIAVGGSATVQFTVNIVTGGYFGPFSNSATGSATGAAASGTTTDISMNGTNPDPNGNGNPGDPGENSSTSVTLTPNGMYGVAMSASSPQLLGDGSYRVVFTVYVKNLGNVAFNNLQVNADLAAAFGLPTTFSLMGAPTASGGFAVNPSYDGKTTIALLAASQTLPVGASGTITLPVNIKPNNNFGPFGVKAIGTGTAATGQSYADASAPGTNPDPNGNGNPGDPGEDDPTMVTLTPHPVLGLAKSFSAVLQPDGKYAVSFVITAKNLGNVQLTNVQVSDDLGTAFPSPATFSLTGGVTATGNLLASTTFNGISDTQLLSGGTIDVGSTQTVSFSALVDGHGVLGPYFNRAYGSGTAGAVTYNDISTSGNNPDPDNNGSPSDPGEDAATVVSLTPSIVAGIAKAVSLVQVQQDGSYRVTYVFTVKNLGNTAINNIKITDQLTTAFPAPATFKVVAGSPVTSGQLIANTAYNGNDVVDLLAAGSKLLIGATNTISLTVDVSLNGGPGLFYNTATLTVTSEDLTSTFSDISAPGNNPDPNGNGNPGDAGENDPTSITLSPRALIGIAKSAGLARKQSNGSFMITYLITLENMGNVPLNDVQVTDDLSNSFPSPATFSISNVTSPTGLNVNTAYNGSTVKTMLNAGSSLTIGEKATISFVVTMTPGSSQTSFYNSSHAVANGAGGTGFTSDVSVGGTDPDPNGNGNPGDPGEDDATLMSLILNPVIGVAKAVTAPKILTDNSYDITYTLTLKNMGDLPLYNVGLYDNLAIAFPNPATYVIKGNPTATGTLLINSTYDGNAQFNLLNPGSSLAVGQMATVTLTINVVVPPSDLTYYNSAVAAGSNEDLSLTYTDISTVGSDPDPNKNGNPNDPNENIPTPVVLHPSPVIGLANSATTPVLQADGTYNTKLTITLMNEGNEPLSDIKVLNSLLNTFPSPAIFKIVTAPVATGNLVVNSNYNGRNIAEIVSSGTLQPGEKQTVEFTVNVDAKDHFGIFWNTAWTTALGQASSLRTSDNSNDGLDPDPARTGQPDQLALNAATPIDLNPHRVLGISNNITSISAQSSCVYDVTFQITVGNYGNSSFRDVSITTNLTPIIASGATYTIESVTATNGLLLDPQFNGNDKKEMLAEDYIMGVGGTSTITLIIRVTPNLQYGPFVIAAIAKGVGAEGVLVTDESVNGQNPDPDGNKIPDEESDTSLTITPLGLSIPQGFSPNGDGDNDTFVIVLDCGLAAELSIFNRWGDRVFYKGNYQNDWDGVSNDGSFLNKPLPEGTYFYQVNLSSGDKITSYLTLKR